MWRVTHGFQMNITGIGGILSACGTTENFPIFPWKLVHFISIFYAFNHVGHCWFLAYWKINVLFSRLCCQKVIDYLETVRSTFFIAYQTITNIWPQVFNQELVYFIKLKCINIWCECLKKIINQITMYETAFPRTLVFWENDLKWAFPFGIFRKSSETAWSTHVL